MKSKTNFQIFNRQGVGIKGNTHFDFYVCIYNFRETMGEKWKDLEKQGYTCKSIELTIKTEKYERNTTAAYSFASSPLF